MEAKGVLLLTLVVGLVIGFAGGYYYMQEKVDEAYQAGYVAGQSVAPTYETPASLSIAFSSGTFDHSSTVASDGSVSTETDKTDTLTIENTDESKTASDVRILLYNPVTGKEGLHDNLETDATEVTITIGGVTYSLYHDGEYVTDGVPIGDLPAGSSVTATVTFTLEKAVAGTFQDGQTYTCYLYVYQPNANYADVVSFTVTT
ncbi:MAG: hypothetical protein DRP18_04865 [Candidatus Aenigmatarchaeota archaeon]|nr:MAG: hypothetical protein DRN78_00005 [Candidatus Korarchaeota archaeon]RLJ04301.1 MAG: hypothetical protein DRP18_04865 [Candidatus Aenigmarchaeota archaeon]